VIHQQRKQLAKNISDHEHKAQYGNSEQHVHNQFTANKSIEQLHLLAQTLAQIDGRAAAAACDGPAGCPYQNLDNLLSSTDHEWRDVRRRNHWRRAGGQHRSNLGGMIHRIARGFLAFAWAMQLNRTYPIPGLLIILFYIISCATVSHHEFSEPVDGWNIKSGQLMYRTPSTTLIGEVLVRFSKTGDFELTVSKGPGITLLSLRQDASFAEVEGTFAQRKWSGPVAQAPPQLRSWLGLRHRFFHASNQETLRYTAGNETFLFRF
jgi:hypothetical protein